MLYIIIYVYVHISTTTQMQLPHFLSSERRKNEHCKNNIIAVGKIRYPVTCCCHVWANNPQELYCPHYSMYNIQKAELVCFIALMICILNLIRMPNIPAFVYKNLEFYFGLVYFSTYTQKRVLPFGFVVFLQFPIFVSTKKNSKKNFLTNVPNP